MSTTVIEFIFIFKKIYIYVFKVFLKTLFIQVFFEKNRYKFTNMYINFLLT